MSVGRFQAIDRLRRRLGRQVEAAAAYRTALELTRQDTERRFLERRLREVEH